MITPLRRPLVSKLVAILLFCTPCLFGFAFNRLLVASLCLRDPYPLGQYFFSINMLSVGFMGLLVIISMFYVIIAWPWSQSLSRNFVVKFLGVYLGIAFTL